MRIALTGARGFTGPYVAAAINAAGAVCVPLDVDLCDGAALDRVMADTDFDRLIHLAGQAFAGSADWRSFYDVNQIGTFALIEAVARRRPGARCVLASSAQVYGPGAAGLIAEDAPTQPANHYAVSKFAMEKGVAMWRDMVEIVIARPFNYTGVGQDGAYLIPKLVDHFCRRAQSVRLGNTWVKRDFGDVRSVADAYVGLATADDAPATVNIATGVIHSIDEIVATLSDISGHRLAVEVDPAFVRANDVAELGGDPTRLRRSLPAWRPRQLEETLRWMYDAQSG